MPCDGACLLTCTSKVGVQPGHLFVGFRADAVDGGACFTDNTEKTESGNTFFQTFQLARENKWMELGITRKYQGKVFSAEVNKTHSIDYSTI